ncbi:MAG: class I SAM-dependent methyltransferase [Acidimicrobiia bacterium]|jgi:SAM-dependent methyltransferase
MLAPRVLPPQYTAWNRRWGAPNGNQRIWARAVAKGMPQLTRRYPRIRGPFAIQPNSDTRRFEYPWAFSVAPVHPPLRVVEIGGGLAGFQFVLAKQGVEVINVDPGTDATGIGWPCDHSSIDRLNAAFGTDVRLVNTTLEHAGIADQSVDRIYSISTIEHIPTEELPGLAREMRRILKPGGTVVLTIDLFLNLVPFTRRVENRFGWNIDVKAFLDELGLEKTIGTERELNGFPEFDPEDILARLEQFCYGQYPALVQLVVLEKPAA